MDFEDMNKMAAQRKPIPDGISRAQRLAYMKLQVLYAQHLHRLIDREEGTRIKNKIAEELEVDMAWEAEYIKACTVMKMLRLSDIPEVKTVVHNIDADPMEAFQ